MNEITFLWSFPRSIQHFLKRSLGSGRSTTWQTVGGTPSSRSNWRHLLKLKGRVAIDVGENERFAPTVAESLIGQTTSDGWLVVGAENEGNQKIWLYIEKEVKDK